MRRQQGQHAETAGTVGLPRCPRARNASNTIEAATDLLCGREVFYPPLMDEQRFQSALARVSLLQAAAAHFALERMY